MSVEGEKPEEKPKKITLRITLPTKNSVISALKGKFAGIEVELVDEETEKKASEE